jgi:AraC family transcriptional regulator, regulatory protein of adaptative response / methylated-DNA-[protein]-cysteine methyltransferase
MIAEPLMTTDDERWQTVLNRDRTADFVFGVRSTGVYCRPGCPSRLPRRDRVVFFESGEDARAAGFRACKRCRPGEPDARTELIGRACALLDRDTDQPLSLESLADQLNVSPYHLHRTFKAVVGVTPRQYAEARRVERLKASLQGGQDVTTALYDAGYSSSSRLYEHSDEELGMAPGTYRRGGAGMRITYGTAPCALGWVLVAGTERGVCAIRLGDSEEELAGGLREQFHAAEIHPMSDGLHGWLLAVVRHLGGDETPLDLPLDIRATAFQRRVWQALRDLPRGRTVSYRQLAENIGAPRAARAVAGACAANPVAIIIPCHRVVREDGSVGGYRWGTERKQQLLESERRSSAHLPV